MVAVDRLLESWKRDAMLVVVLLFFLFLVSSSDVIPVIFVGTSFLFFIFYKSLGKFLF
jgi:hypothetical protein